MGKEGDYNMISNKDKIKKSIRAIQEILVDDIYMSMESAKAINAQLVLILLLMEEDDKNGNS